MKLKLKVWDTIQHKMFKPQGITFDTATLAPFAVKVPGRSWEPVGKFEILQWTGLHDANGVDIFEGDYIKFSSDIYKAAWNETEACFELVGLLSSAKRNVNDIAIGYLAGNQFEN